MRGIKSHLLDEPLPEQARDGEFTTGSVGLFLLVVSSSPVAWCCRCITCRRPESAYESVRFIMEQLTFGSIVRGLHFFGASFIVIAAVIHMLRVVLFGSRQEAARSQCGSPAWCCCS